MRRYDVAPLDGLDPELGLLFATLNDGRREWQDNLGTPSQEAITWQPYPDGPSIGGIILHLASCEAFWLQKFAAGQEIDETQPAIAYDLTLDQYVPSWPTPPSHPLDWYLDVLEQQRHDTLRLVTEHGKPLRMLPRKDYEVSYRWILAHLVEHDSYHGGQAVLLHEMWKKMQIKLQQ